MPRTISSAQTFLLKFVFPLAALVGFFGGAVPMLFGNVPDHGQQLDPQMMKWLTLAAWIVGGLFVYRNCVPLKRVSMTDTDLHISNFRREIVVPLRDIDEVTENRWISGQPVTLRFRNRTEFGHTVVFIPRARPFAFFSRNPLVAKLREAAAGARLDVK